MRSGSTAKKQQINTRRVFLTSGRNDKAIPDPIMRAKDESKTIIFRLFVSILLTLPSLDIKWGFQWGVISRTKCDSIAKGIAR